MSKGHGKPFTSQSGRAASRKSPWRGQVACQSLNANTVRAALDAGWNPKDPATDQTIGISMRTAARFSVVRDFLLSAGWRDGDIKHIAHPNDARDVRRAGGLVVHVEPAQRPNLAGNISSAGLAIEVGDFVLEGAVDPGEYLPRLLGRLSRLAQS